VTTFDNPNINIFEGFVLQTCHVALDLPIDHFLVGGITALHQVDDVDLPLIRSP